MSATQGCNDNTAVVGKYKEALKQRLGEEIFQAWFVNGIRFDFASDEATGSKDTATNGRLIVSVRGQFALDRLRRNFIREMRGAAMQACGQSMQVELQLAAQPQQVELPLGQDAQGSVAVEAKKPKRKPRSSAQSQAKRSQPKNSHPKQSPTKKPLSSVESLTQLTFPNLPVNAIATGNQNGQNANGLNANGRSNGSADKTSFAKPVLQTANASAQTDPSRNSEAVNADSPASSAPTASLSTFIDGSCNHFALTAVKMVCETPNGGSPLFLCGPPGVGKTHLLTAMADYLRRGRRMRRVIHITAEKFTNDFIASVSSGSLTAFRARYRDLDALLIDDVQFLSAKKATLRELQYTIDGLSDRGKTLVLSGSHAPTEISGLSPELAGRMGAGFVCPMQALDLATRTALLQQRVDQINQPPWPEEIVTEIASLMVGDGRRIQSIVNLVDLLQRMYGRMPTMNEIRQHAGDQLRNGQITTLASIESAVAKIFQLDDGTLKSRSQARTATEPRMLAMYLSRELTPAAFSEIGRHYGGRSHSAAMLAVTRVEQWLRTGKPVGRGQASFSARDALSRIESMLRSG